MGDNRTPWVQNWTFLIAQRAPWNSLFEIGCVGSHTADMLIAANLSNIDLVPVGGYFQPNPVTGITCYLGAASPTCNHSGPPNLSQYRPWNYSSIQVASPGSYSNYNALPMMWQKQAGRSTFTVNYTFSKVLAIRDRQTDNGNGNGTVIDWFNMKNNYGVLAYDHNQHLQRGVCAVVARSSHLEQIRVGCGKWMAALRYVAVPERRAHPTEHQP